MMDSFLLLAIAAIFLAIACGMVLLERAALKSARSFFKNNYTRQVFWMTYLSLFVLGGTFLLKAGIG